MAESRAERMQAIYDQVPRVADCKGHCWISCSAAVISPWERRRLALAGHRITPALAARRGAGDFWCEALGPDGRCLAYDIRPFICRLWGAVDWMACPWGCRPEGGWLPNEVAFRLFLESLQLGGIRHPVPLEELQRASDPAGAAAIAREIAGMHSDDWTRFRAYGAVLPPEVTGRPRPAPGSGHDRTT